MVNTVNMNEQRAKVLLSLIPEIGPVKINRLLTYFGTAEKVISSSADELVSIAGISRPVAEKIANAKNLYDIDKEYEKAKQLGVNILTADSEKYPAQLRVIPDPPVVLYTFGEFKEVDIFSIGIVGTRKPTSYGCMAAEKISKELIDLNVSIVSGLARGIDTVAHRAALKNEGRTIAVLGNGLGVHYPPENRSLEEKIVSNGIGVIVSEFPILSKPERSNFPQRNRLISALSLGVIVIEGDIISGALITAKCALDQGKDVFALPGSIFSKYSKGPHMLLKQGAKLIESATDVVEEISNLAEWVARQYKLNLIERNVKLGNDLLLNPAEESIVSFLEKEPHGINIDELIALTNSPVTAISQNLLSLELKGIVKSFPGKIYIKA